MTERRPENHNFSEWEKGFKHVEQGRPLSFAMRDFIQVSRDILDQSRETGKSMFIKDDQNPGRVHFWVYPVEHQKIMARSGHNLIRSIEAAEEEMQEKGAVSSEAIRRMLFESKSPPQKHKPVEDSDEVKRIYSRDLFHQQTGVVLSEIEHSGTISTLAHLGHAEFHVVPIPLVYQEGFEDEFMREEEGFTQEIKNKREEIGLER